MKIVVVSDSHGSRQWRSSIKNALKQADCIYHLGDYASDAAELEQYCSCPVKCVLGNCDFNRNVPILIDEIVDGLHVFATHGHRYHVKSDLDMLCEEAKSRNAKLCLYGHTHVPDITMIDGIWFVNPGSVAASRGVFPNTYAMIEWNEERNIYPSIVKV